MNIVFCLGSMGKGGAERVVSNLSNYLAEKGNNISIITTVLGNCEYEIDKSIKLYSLDEKNKSKNFITKNIKRLRNLKMLIKEISPDVIVSFLPEPSYRVLILRKFLKIPTIVSVRNDPKIEYKSKISKIFMKFTYPMADGFVFQTEDAKEYFNKRIQKKSTIIPNPISKEFIEKDDFYYVSNSNKLINVGRLEEQKNQKLLLMAFKELSVQYPKLELYIYGEGSLRKEMENFIKDNNLTNKVFLPGEVNDIKNKLKEAKMFILTSNYEGMPNTLMEAMALGIPCISTDCPCGGPKFLIQNEENGILVPVNDQEALKKAIQELLNNKEKCEYIAQKANGICEKLNPDKINSTWEEFINEITINHKLRRKNGKR